MVKITSRRTYGAQHSRKYKPSVVSSFLVDRDDKGRVVKIHSDVHLLLHQENLQKKIGIDAIRNYIDQMHVNATPRPNLTDDELFGLIEPKEINNITDAWKFAKYLQDNSDKVKTAYNDYVAKRKELEQFKQKYNIKDE